MSSLDVRLQAAQGLRNGLAEFWPDESRWCQGRFTVLSAEGRSNINMQRCLAQMLAESFRRSPRDMIFCFNETSPYGEALRAVLTATGSLDCLDLCAINNSSDFATLKGYVETAATNLERAA